MPGTSATLSVAVADDPEPRTPESLFTLGRISAANPGTGRRRVTEEAMSITVKLPDEVAALLAEEARAPIAYP